MNQNALLLAVDNVRLTFRNVASDVVDYRHSYTFAEDALKRPARGVRYALPVRPGEVSGCGHRLEVSLALRRLDWRASELPIGNMQVVLAHGLIQMRDVIGANLVTKPARPRVDQNHDTILLEVVAGRSCLIEDFI